LSEVVRIANIEVRKGEKKTGYIDVGETAVERVRIPVAIVNGAKQGPTLCISGGVHGCEYSSIEAVVRTLRQTDPPKLSGKLLIVPVLNMAGFDARGPQGGMSTPFLNPIDNLNLNRIFPGNPDGTMSYQIAAAFMTQVVAKADYYVDCHGGDLNEELSSYVIVAQTGDGEKDRIAKEVLARSFDCEFMAISGGGGGSIESASKMYGKPAIVVEAGGYGRLEEDAVQFIVKGITNIMKKLKMIDGTPTPTRSQKVRQRWMVYAKRGGLLYTPPLGTKVKRGEKVGEVRNVFGELLETLEAPVDGVVTFRRSPFPASTNDRAFGVFPHEDLPAPKARPYP